MEPGVLLQRRLLGPQRLLALLGQPQDLVAERVGAADRQGLDHDDRRVHDDVQRLGVLDDAQVDHGGGRADAEEDQRQRPEQARVEEPGDDEDEEQPVALHQDRAQRHHAEEVDREADRRGLLPLRGEPRVPQVGPRGGGGDGTGGEEAVLGGPVRHGQAQRPAESQRHVRDPVHDETEHPRDHGLVLAVLLRPVRCPRHADHSHLKTRAASTPKTRVVAPIMTRGSAEGAVPFQLSRSVCTLGGT